jgi:hypothetical protein
MYNFILFTVLRTLCILFLGVLREICILFIHLLVGFWVLTTVTKKNNILSSGCNAVQSGINLYRYFGGTKYQCLTSDSCWVLASLNLQCVPPKLWWIPTGLHGVTTQQIVSFIQLHVYTLFWVLEWRLDYVIFHCVQLYHSVGLVSNMFINHFITLYSSCVVLTQVDIMASLNIAHSYLHHSQFSTFSHHSTANAVLLYYENYREIKTEREAFL